MFMCEQEHLWTEVILFGTFFFSEGAWGEGLSGRGVYLRTQQSVHTLSTSEWRPLIEDTQYLSFLWWNETDCQCDVGKKTLWNIAFVVVVGWGFSRTAESSFRNVFVPARICASVCVSALVEVGIESGSERREPRGKEVSSMETAAATQNGVCFIHQPSRL